MIVETGHFALVLAFVLALIQSVVPVWGAVTSDRRLMETAAPVANALFVLVALSFAVLTWAYLASDFSVVNVWENSHSAKPLIFKISGVWGNHEGSMLLWVLILVLFGSLVALFSGNVPAPLRATVLGVQGWITAAFLLFILATSNPFERIPQAPIEGNDLNPLSTPVAEHIHGTWKFYSAVGKTFPLAFDVTVAGQPTVTVQTANFRVQN